MYSILKMSCLSLLLFLLNFNSLIAKEIRQKALEIGDQYFFIDQISKDFHTKDEKTLLASIGRSDLIFVGKMPQGNIEQSGYISPLKTEFIMVTFVYLNERTDFLSVNITKFEEDIPTQVLKKLAHDSRTMPQTQGVGELYYLGDSYLDGRSVRHSMSIISVGETIQVSWNIAKLK